ncbi:hypothetical protein SAMN03080614_10291, partial [Anaerobranca gottschalkii DSM 13577]
MNIIIQQKCEEFINKVLEFFSEDETRIMEEIETNLKELTDNFILEMMRTYFELIDRKIVEDKVERKQKGIVIERK